MIGKNNPLNIRHNSSKMWKGQDLKKPQTKGFCNFIDVRYSIRACAYLLMRSYRKKGLRTYAELIKRYAPESENPTWSYINYVVPSNRMPFDVPTTQFDFAQLVFKMSVFESGSEEYCKNPDYVLGVIKSENLFVYEPKSAV